MGQALRGEDLSVFGKGAQTRSFCYVDDLIEGIYRLLFSDYSTPVNLGNPDEITIIEFAHEILQLTNSDQKISFNPLPEGDPLKRQPDISLAKKELNWQPETSRVQGMKITFDYFKNLPTEKLHKRDHKDFSKHIKN
jgi:dTDP-glucose 4,6-dehydratase